MLYFESYWGADPVIGKILFWRMRYGNEVDSGPVQLLSRKFRAAATGASSDHARVPRATLQGRHACAYKTVERNQSRLIIDELYRLFRQSTCLSPLRSQTGLLRVTTQCDETQA